MSTSSGHRRILGITPFATPDAALAVAVARAGATGVLDLGSDREAALTALTEAVEWWRGPLAVRVGAACSVTPGELPASISLVVLADDAAWTITEALGQGAPGRAVMVEVGSPDAARAAVEAGVTKLLARGSESGVAGSASAFVLLQHLMAAELGAVEIWLAGGIGPHTAAAAVAGGATGVVLDSQLALARECELPREVAAAVRAMDGTETVRIGGHRIYVRPDLTRPEADGLAEKLGRTLSALPVGEDGALARPLADKHVTAGGIVAAVAASIESSISAAVATAQTTGHPPRIVQGPMTRVSDQAAFAKAVAAEGGLPFLALALMTGEDARALLVETAELLGDLPWGVGILGFVPDEVRAAQLEAVHEIKPQYALIAGGRPAQAAPLEAAGITTFLHVPSPALLDRFLAEGGRRFVFEGSECGGHVGPRASFPLWDAQIRHLLAYGSANDCLNELDVLFAGGIHDARSAAMVAAAAAPITAAGGRAGVLMGTAYLFTTEAVTGNAIGPAFQRAALACDSTVLLETAPGHATRCAPTAFVDTFAETRDRMLAEGTPREQVWAELEKLNVGRLRIASKGIRREGNALIPVDENTQARDGMVMIGDVARLRTAVTTVAELHAAVTTGASAFLTSRAAELDLAPAAEATTGLEIAVVGMAGVFPQAGDLAEFWAHVLANHDAITEVPAERWDPAVYYAQGAGVDSFGGPGSTSKWGGFLPEIPFDALAYGIPPQALASIEPVQLLSLEVAARALRDAGYASSTGTSNGTGREFDRERTGVIFGAEPGTDLSAAYSFRALYPQLHGEMPAELDAQLPKLTEDSFPGALANVISGRIANRLDLGGANYTVDAACASALAALEVACMQLRGGAADMVLAGGADIHNGIQDYLQFASVGALSKTGHCKPFDANADGISLGEGVATIVLKRLADAERDGDKIYAVIAGIGSSSDGKSLGLTAPRPEGQRRALERAYAQAGVSPADVGLVEAHGTGTVVGDRTELTVLSEVFAARGAKAGSIALGSVKSQIGHTKCTAGLAGLIKAALALHAGVLPPTGKITTPNPAWVAGENPFVFDTNPRPWPADRPRVAGVSAFGFGGTNFHAVLTGYTNVPAPKHGLDQWPSELFVIRGASRDAAIAALDELTALVAANDGAGRPWRLRDLARTTDERASGPVQVTFVATDLDDLAARIPAARSFSAGPAVFISDPARSGGAAGEVAFLFPGQGSQRPGMLADLFTAFPRLGDLLAIGRRWAPTMFPPAAFDDATRDAQRKALTDTRVAQPALGIADMAMFRTLRGLGVTPDHLAGHSYGELAALCAAGAMTPADLLEISAARGEAILAAAGTDPGTMAAVSAGEGAIRAALNGQMSRGGVVIANLNSPEQTVISGPSASIDSAVAALKDRGIAAQRIPVACAFHSPLVADASRTLEAELSRRQIGSPHLPVWANATAAPYPLGSSAVRELLAAQVASPVRFAEQIEAMYAAGARVFVECGPGRVLTGLVGSILGDRPHLAVATDAPGKHGISALLGSLGRLLAAGVTADTDALYAGRDARIVSAQDVPRRPGWAVNGHLVRTAEGTPVANGLRPVQRVEVSTAAPASPANGMPAPAAQAPAVQSVTTVPADGREAVVLEFLRSSREMIAAQRDVVLGFLGAAPAPVAQPAPGAQPAPIVASVVQAAPVIQDAVAPALIVEPASVVSPVEPVLAAVAAPAIPAPAASPEISGEHVLTVLTELIAERTGYPAEMLGADLDLEADLSIASLKRTEILGLLADHLPGAGLDEDFQAQLSRIRTMAGMVSAIVERAPVAIAVQPVPAPAPAELSAEHVLTVLAELIAERTGYPAEMLGADLDLEADLSIASLKRTEILGLLADRLPGAGLDEDFQAQLSRMRTMAAMVDAITGAPAPVIAAAAPVIEPPALDREPVRRYLMQLTPAEPVTSAEGDLTGRHVTMVGGGLGIAIELADALTARGATVRSVSTDADTELGDVDILVHLGAAGPSEPPSLPDAFAVLRRAVLGGARQLLVVTGTGGRMGHRTATDAPPRSDAPAGMGLAGLVRTIAREYPHVSCRALDIDPKETADLLTTRLLAELVNPAGPEVVGYAEGVRSTLALVPAALEVDAIPTAAELNLTPGSVVLLTGGARGITARAAAGLASVSGCHIVLWGRSPLPAATEDPATARAADEAELRRALIAGGITVPAQVEREVARLLAEREIRSTMVALQAVAASVTYQAIDVRDAVAVGDGIAEVMARHGRIDGVVHGAGVLDDRLIADKSADGFARVWETKVDGARALAAALPADLGFLVMFGSVSGVFGNRGQCDYAAANDALDCLARAWETRFTGRVVSVDWGPWLPTELSVDAGSAAGSGMVSAELLRTYARQGVGAIHPDDGVAALLRELAHGASPQVVYVCAEPAAFDVAFSGGLRG
ncbi:type I polyketide synthase [Sporichthya sp.]|uniref:type I polyketide synthase n=1 Tax=Sporichthya sp. TaxID=65475 RepID=UPI00181EE506|nr:type I polyketide synthase [Sporichthya sp.]MBA3744623.1 SDR family NAD(P)-dependent oxidoreductase [Sporichthya sp.]